MSGMVWIKYYANGRRESSKLENLLVAHGPEGWGRYWLLLGILAQKFSEDCSKVSVKKETLLTELLFKSKRSLDKFILSSEVTSILSCENSGETYFFDSSILLELKSRDFKSARSNRVSTAHKNKIKNKEEEKEKETYLEANDLLQLWNAQGLKKINQVPMALREIKHQVDLKLKDQIGLYQIKRAITNYALVFLNEKFYYSVEFSLIDFMRSPAAQKFYEEPFDASVYIKARLASGSSQSVAQARQDRMVNMLREV